MPLLQREPGALREERLREASEYVRLPEPLSPAQRDALLPDAARELRLVELAPDAWPALLREWRYWARPTQLAPGGNWIIWLILSGRGWGKTRTGVEWIREGIDDGTGFPFGLIGPTRNDTYDRLVHGEEGAPGLVRLYEHFPERLQPKVNSQRNTITFPGFDARPEAIGYIYTAEKPEVRGPNMRRWLCDEFAQWPYLRACWDNIEMTTRAAGLTPPRICVTTTPRPLQVLKDMLDDPRIAVTFGSTFANAANLAASWVQRMAAKYGLGRLGAQELFGLLLGDNPDALYHQTTIDRYRCPGLPPPFVEITIGVDNAIATNPRNDLTGIAAVGKDAAGQLYPLMDLSGADWDRSKKGLAYWHPDEARRHKPDEWAELVCRLYYHLRATYPGAKVTVAAERNRGGDLVRANVIQVDRLTGGGGAIPIVDPETRDSKGEMHENLSTAYENGMVHHVGQLPRLEGEMCEWNPRMPGHSPNRADALRIACTHLAPEIWKDLGPAWAATPAVQPQPAGPDPYRYMPPAPPGPGDGWSSADPFAGMSGDPLRY